MNNNNYDKEKDKSSTDTEITKLFKELEISASDKIEQELNKTREIEQVHYNIGKPVRKTIRARIIHD